MKNRVLKIKECIFLSLKNDQFQKIGLLHWFIGRFNPNQLIERFNPTRNETGSQFNCLNQPVLSGF
jgi:hypothetical protein